MNKKKN